MELCPLGGGLQGKKLEGEGPMFLRAIPIEMGKRRASYTDIVTNTYTDFKEIYFYYVRELMGFITNTMNNLLIDLAVHSLSGRLMPNSHHTYNLCGNWVSRKKDTCITLTLFRTLLKNPVNGPVGYFWTPEHHGMKYQVTYMMAE